MPGSTKSLTELFTRCPIVQAKALCPQPGVQEKWSTEPRLPQAACITCSPDLPS